MVVLGVHCDIYKSSYNISLVVHPLHHSPLPLFPHSWNNFNRSHFSIFIHDYIIFLPHSLFYTLSLYLPPCRWYQHPDRTGFTFLFSIFEKGHFCLFKIAIQGVLLRHFHVYMEGYIIL
jgi:hypothetical protein